MAVHQHIRRAIINPTGPLTHERFTEIDLNVMVHCIRNKKAPGFDGLRPEIIKRSYVRNRRPLLDIMNTMWNTGEFPADWKIGIVKTFLKGTDKDPMQLKSYRPITLLPGLGKIAEKLIAFRLNTFLTEVNYFSDRQYGFRRGLGTVDALCALKAQMLRATQKYVLEIFLDISGAFDNAWWPLILLKLNEAECPRELYQLLQSYLTDRTATLYIGQSQKSKTLTKGCPQGSVLGPILWNVLFEDLLRTNLGQDVTIQAYADDAVVIVLYEPIQDWK